MSGEESSQRLHHVAIWIIVVIATGLLHVVNSVEEFFAGLRRWLE